MESLSLVFYKKKKIIQRAIWPRAVQLKEGLIFLMSSLNFEYLQIDFVWNFDNNNRSCLEGIALVYHLQGRPLPPFHLHFRTTLELEGGKKGEKRFSRQKLGNPLSTRDCVFWGGERNRLERKTYEERFWTGNPTTKDRPAGNKNAGRPSGTRRSHDRP